MSALRKLTSAMAVIAGITTAGTSGLAQAAPAPAASGCPAAPPRSQPAPRSGAMSPRPPGSRSSSGSSRRLAAAQSFATAVSTPGSPLFRHYLSPDAYAARFGAPRPLWRRSSRGCAPRALPPSAPTRSAPTCGRRPRRRTINAAFRVRLRLYKSLRCGQRRAVRPARQRPPVSLPASAARSVLGVTGLDNAAPILPLQMHGRGRAGRAAKPGTGALLQLLRRSTSDGLPRQFGTTKFATDVCGYSPARYGRPTGPTRAIPAPARRSPWWNRAWPGTCSAP